MNTIVGIDVSLTGTGMARINTDTWDADTWCSIHTGHRGDTLVQRSRRLLSITADVMAFVGDAELAVIEAPAYSTPGGSTWDRSGLWWRIVSRLLREDIPVTMVAPTTRAKFATGKGRSDKAAVTLAAKWMWQDWIPTFTSHTNDESDALILASIGVAAICEPPFPMNDYRTQIAKELKLPEEYFA